MPISPFKDQPAGYQRIGLPEQGKIRTKTAKKIDAIDVAGQISGNWISLNIPIAIGGSSSDVSIYLAASVTPAHNNTVMILYNASDTITRDRIVSAINGETDTSIVNYGVSWIDSDSLSTTYVGTTTSGMPGIIASNGTTSTTITIESASPGEMGNRIRFSSSPTSFVASEYPMNGGFGSHSIIDTRAIDPFRQGVSVTTPYYFFNRITPVVMTRGLPELDSSQINHQMEQDHFGQPPNFTDPSEEVNAPFEDIIGTWKYAPQLFMEDEHATGGFRDAKYPVILNSTVFVSPQLMDGVIEPLDVRTTIVDASIDSPYTAHRVKADLMTGNWLGNEHGACEIKSVIENRQGKHNNYFLDSQEVIWPTVSIRYIWGYSDPVTETKPIYRTRLEGIITPGFLSEYTNLIAPFDDIVNFGYIEDTIPIDGDTSFRDAIPVNTGSLEVISAIGTKYKSAVCGFQYRTVGLANSGLAHVTDASGIYTVLGTDSVAFGGFTK